MIIDMEKTFLRRPRQDLLYDVIVCGGGPAGIGAALAAAICGARTLILEARSQFGGTATAGMWMCFNWIFKDNQDGSRGGVHQILVDELAKYGSLAARPGRRNDQVLNNGGNLDIHPEYLKKVLFDLFEHYEIDYSLYAQAIDVLKDEDTVRGVVVIAKEGAVTYQGRVIIDATGDGDVAYYAGCEMEDTNPETGWRAPHTLLFALCNLDVERVMSTVYESGFRVEDQDFASLRDAMLHGITQGYQIPGGVSIDQSTIPGVLNFNYSTTAGQFFDGTSSYDLTCVENLGILQATEFIRFVKDFKIPGFENAALMRTGGFAAVRETRRLVGEYVFTEKDLIEGATFPDAIACKFGGRDPMGTTRPNVNISQGTQYPYRSLLPKKVEGLLVAGRCGSATLLGHYGGKSMGNMMAFGQAAGIAAALCVKLGKQPRKLDYKLIQAKLAEMNVVY
ncbi:MAG: FAD-dependent oxidoreductase [Symbiobacteriaceae bacterium]|nr:FAD-dependent oxidoreductase [Symbiobacteriaceae bacterium]